MQHKNPARKSRPSKSARNIHPKSTNHYLYFTKASKKAGTLATEAYFQVREFLTRDFNPKKDFGQVISKLIPKPSAAVANTPVARKKEDDIRSFIKKSNEVLAEASTVFPFTLFPDTVTLDRKKLVVTIRSFFMTSKVLTIQIDEILNISVNAGPFFGSLHIAIRGLTSEDHFDVTYLWRKDAIHLKHMIEGYIIALKDNIKLDKLEKEELIRTLAELGHDSNPERL